MSFKRILAAPMLLTVCASVLLSGCRSQDGVRSAERGVGFTVTADIREFVGTNGDGREFFGGVCEAIKEVGQGDFMISPGDIDPPAAIRETLDRYFGRGFVWYPVVGNHEAETPADMEWLRRWGSNDIPGLVRRGPPGSETTTYSFDRGPVHFAVVNQYYNGRKDIGAKGDVVPGLYEWLKADLASSKQPVKVVIGHEPILPMPDMDNGRLRHEKDSLNAYSENCRRFHELLIESGVKAYFCAHTHNASITNLNGVWQIDAGHARGKGDPGAPSTFLKVRIDRAGETTVEFYRQPKQGDPYKLTRSVRL